MCLLLQNGKETLAIKIIIEGICSGSTQNTLCEKICKMKSANNIPQLIEKLGKFEADFQKVDMDYPQTILHLLFEIFAFK